MDCDNVWSDHKNESFKTVEQCSPYFSNISANTNTGYYNVPHYGLPEFPSYNNYLAKPCHSNMNSCYNQGNAMGYVNFKPFPCAQPFNAATERKNCSQMQPKAVHSQGGSKRSNRKKKLNSKQNKSNFSRRPNIVNYTNTEKNNEQKIFDTRANINNAVPRSQLLSTGNVGNRNNVLLNKCSFTEKNLQYSSLGTNQTHLQHLSACGNQTNSSTNFIMNDTLLTAASGTDRLGLDFDTGASIYFQEENITNFANEDSSASNQFNDVDDILTKSIPDVDSPQPLDQTQSGASTNSFLDAPEGNLLLNAQKTTNLVNNVNADGEEQIFTLKTVCEGKDESGKDVILLLAVPEVQRQIAQGNGSVDGRVETQRVQSEENTSTRAGTRENTGSGNENDLQFVQNTAEENSQEVENMNDDGYATISFNPAEYLGYKLAEKCKKRKRQTASANTQTQSKKCNTSNSEAETTALEGLSIQRNLNEIHSCQPRCNKSNSVAETDGLEGSSQRNLDEIHSCQPRCRKANSNFKTWRARLRWKNNSNSFKSLRNQYFCQITKKYFKEKHINDRNLQKFMRLMLSRVGGSMMHSIWCFFETLKTSYNARAYN